MKCLRSKKRLNSLLFYYSGLGVPVCFITAGPITKLFAWARGEDSGLRLKNKHSLVTHTGYSSYCVCFITAGPITKLFAWEGGESGGHVVIRETTSRGLCGLV